MALAIRLFFYIREYMFVEKLNAYLKHDPKVTLYPASVESEKKSDLIVFVHFFGGNQKMLKRHISLVNQNGYDAVGFDLSYDSRWQLKKLPASKYGNLGIRYLWADELESVLNQFAERSKIIYAFSNPCAAAIECTARREAKDIKAIICDSGPFLHMWTCSYNLISEHFKIKNIFAKSFFTGLIRYGWGINHEQNLKKDLQSLPDSFPVLSFRAWNDKLVPVKAIEDAFLEAPHLKLQIVNLTESGHLDGLKSEPQLYKDKLLDFLAKL